MAVPTLLGLMRWPPYRHVIFDCDSTLTRVEGIDVLAGAAGRGAEVARLTQAAMDGEVDLDDVYGERLAAISPSRADVAALRRDYKDNAVPDAAAVIGALAQLGHEVYIVSGGLEEPVREFGIALGVPEHHIRAVGLEYDQLAGDWWTQRSTAERYLDYGRGALAMSQGKAQVIAELVADSPGRRLLVGDGTSDLLAASAVDLFVGYGGVVRRPRVEAEAPVFLTEMPLSPTLPLAAGPGALHRAADTALFVDGLQRAGRATWNDHRLGKAFAEATAAVDRV